MLFAVHEDHPIVVLNDHLVVVVKVLLQRVVPVKAFVTIEVDVPHELFVVYRFLYRPIFLHLLAHAQSQPAGLGTMQSCDYDFCSRQRQPRSDAIPFVNGVLDVVGNVEQSDTVRLLNVILQYLSRELHDVLVDLPAEQLD